MENARPHRKAIESWLKTISKAIEAADMKSISTMLADSNSFLLDSFRESKLISRSSLSIRRELLQELERAAECHFPSKGAEFKGYLHFFSVVEEEITGLREHMANKISEIPLCSKEDLLACRTEVFEIFLVLMRGEQDEIPVDVTVAERERWVHHTNGAHVDLVNAIARAINECSRVKLKKNARTLNKKERRKAIGRLLEIVRIAGEINSLEWLFDCVSYGDFSIEEYSETPTRTFKFKFSDPRRSWLRALGIRRSLIIALKPTRAQRVLRNRLFAAQEIMEHDATSYYLQSVGLQKNTKLDLTNTKIFFTVLLMQNDVEDDLLAFASEDSFDKVIVYYLLAMTLLWHTIAAEAVRTIVPNSRKRILNPPKIPADFVVGDNNKNANAEFLASAMEALTSELPSRNHSTLVTRPFIRATDYAYPFLNAPSNLWTVAVRESLIKGGAIGKDVGAVWENYLTGLFRDSDWSVIGQGIKLKRKKEYLTDIDLLILRDDLLLVVQIKALVGSSHTVHDHWENRKIIEQGCLQGLTAAEFLESNSNSLISICGRRIAESIKIIQPVVLTNADLYNGWEYAGVPVMAEVTRKAICEGSKVEYYDARNGSILHAHTFVKKDDLTTKKFFKCSGDQWKRILLLKMAILGIYPKISVELMF